jgi:Holliday junction resolvase
MTPESLVKKRAAAILKKHGAYYFFPVTGGYGRSGVPDIVVCWRGQFIGIECKAGKNTTTALQEKNLREIRDSGGLTVVVNEHTVQELDNIFRTASEIPTK